MCCVPVGGAQRAAAALQASRAVRSLRIQSERVPYVPNGSAGHSRLLAVTRSCELHMHPALEHSAMRPRPACK